MRVFVSAGVFSLAIAAIALSLHASIPREWDFFHQNIPVSHSTTEITATVASPSSLGVFAPSRETASRPNLTALQPTAYQPSSDPYGNIVIQSGVAANVCPFRHRTRYYDRESWLYYYGYRYYDPSTTKWLSKDPKGEAGGWNLTAFCACDPVNNYDALGMWSWPGFGQGVWDFVSEPFKAASDTFVLTPMLAVNNLLSDTDIALEDTQFSSMLANGTSARRLTGESGWEAVGAGYADLGLAVGTLGLYPMAKNIGDSWALYSTGDITFDELDYRLSRGAGGATAAALTGSAASRFAGRGWTGRIRPHINSHLDQTTRNSLQLENSLYSAGKKSNYLIRLQHGTTRLRAGVLFRNGPDANFIEPGGGSPAGGFSTARAEGPFEWGSPMDYANGKAELFPTEGGPAILEIEVPQNIIDSAIDLKSEVRFEPGDGLEGLLEIWPNIPKRIK